MKQRITTLLAAGMQGLLVATAAAQVPNGGLEDWTLRNGAERPLHWVTTDDILEAAGQQPWRDVTKTQDRYAGSLALRMQNTLVPGRGGEGGIVALGSPSATPGTPPLDGLPYSARPTGLQFYYKRSGTNVVLDSALVVVVLSRSVSGQRTVVAQGEKLLLDAPATYQRDEVPLQYRLAGAPDSAFVYILSASARRCTAGNALFIDELQFVGATTTAAHPATGLGRELRVYPNPSETGVFTLDLTADPAAAAGARLVVLDGLGRVVDHRTLAATEQRCPVDLRRYPAGRYTLQLHLRGGVVTRPLVKY